MFDIPQVFKGFKISVLYYYLSQDGPFFRYILGTQKIFTWSGFRLQQESLAWVPYSSGEGI